MTSVEDRSTNGHSVKSPTVPLQASVRPLPVEDPEVIETAAERDRRAALQVLDNDDVFAYGTSPRSKQERDADREVDEELRSLARQERLRSGKAQVRKVRRDRWRTSRQSFWDERAERVRDRLLDPARNLGSDHRRWVFSALGLFALIAGGVAFMSITVHDGVVGTGGPVYGYLIEPPASVLLVISLLAQFTARQRGVEMTRRSAAQFIAFDLGLAAASLVLNTVPFAVRYGLSLATLAAHALVPVLIVAAVVGWHQAASIYSEALALSKNDTTFQAHLALVRKWLADKTLPVDTSRRQIEKQLRAYLDGGISTQQAQRVARAILGR